MVKSAARRNDGQNICLPLNDKLNDRGRLWRTFCRCKRSRDFRFGSDADSVCAVTFRQFYKILSLIHILENGMEVLLHIGIDTVGMNGDGFEYLVQEGQKVSAGTPLIKFDRAKIKAAGHPDVTVCIICNPGNAKAIRFRTGMKVTENETAVVTFQ